MEETKERRSEELSNDDDLSMMRLMSNKETMGTTDEVGAGGERRQRWRRRARLGRVLV